MKPGLSHWMAETGTVPLRDITLGALLREQAAHHAGRLAIIFDEADTDLQVRWTYAELDRRVDEVAKALVASGVAHGDRVAVMSPNRPEWVLLEYALARIGAVLVTVNPAFRQAELAYLLTQGRIGTLFVVGEYRGFDLAQLIGALLAGASCNGAVAAPAYPDLTRLVQLGNAPLVGALSFADFLAGAGAVDESVFAARVAAVQSRDIAQIQYTSGTTGKPKGVMLTHYGTVNNAMLAGDRAGYRETDVMVSAMPFFHTAGCVCNVIGMAAVGGCLVALESFDAARMLDLIEAHGGTITNAVPTMHVRMLQDEELVEGRRNLHSWRVAYTGGAAIPPTLMREVLERTGAEPVIIMGMTECSPIITQTVPQDPMHLKLTTAGVPLPHVEIRIADLTNGATVPIGAEGELLIRGFLVTAGYFDMPDRTAETIDKDGWLHSGDIATLDAGGYLRIVGRIKDMLIRGGENIYPAEIEEYLLGHEDIAEAQVVGVPDADLGEEIFAFVVPRDGRQVDGESIRQWCRQTLSRHKLPRYVSVLARMPQTANGKVRKVELRELARAIIDEGRAA